MKNKLLLLSLTLLLLFSSNRSKAQVNINDSLALVDMYNTMNGPNWYIKDNWLQGPVISWFRVYVENNRVVQLYFNFDNNIVGSFPSSFGNLTELRTFIFEANKISGTIPPSFASLTKLTDFIVTNSQLSGSIPTFFGKYQQLTGLDLRDNQLSGSIPASLGKIANLAYIQADDNQLTGKIPASICNLEHLQILGLSNNKLSGIVPAFQSKVLDNLFLNNNSFSGPIPDFHQTAWIDELALDHNQFSGNIPEWMGNLSSYSSILLNNNNLTGIIPRNFGNLRTFWIDISFNNLSGNVPSTILSRPRSSLFYLNNNQFTFDGIDTIVSNNPAFTFGYSPQSQLPIHFYNQGTYGKLSVYAGGTLANNTYNWYKNGTLYKTIIGDSIFLPDSAGNYFVKVSNSIVTNLILTSDTITISESCVSAPTNATTNNVQSTSATLLWSSSNGALQYQVKYKPAGGTFINLSTTSNSITITGLQPNTKYTWKVRAQCSQGFSPFSANRTFITANNFIASDKSGLLVKDGVFSISPNPVRDIIAINFYSVKTNAFTLQVYDMQGKLMLTKTGLSIYGNNQLYIPVTSLTKGMYMAKLICESQTLISKFIKE